MLNRPRTYHLSGEMDWIHCDHQHTRVDPDRETVMLASAEQVNLPGEARAAEGVFNDWFEARRGGLFVPPLPHECGPPWPLIADDRYGLLRLHAGRWRPLHDVGARDGWPELFGAPPGAAVEGAMEPLALFGDRCGRVFILDDRAQRLIVLAATDFRLLDVLSPPQHAVFCHAAAADWGLLAADRNAQQLWRAPFDGEWSLIPPDVIPDGFAPITVAGAGRVAVALLRPWNRALRSLLAIVSEGEPRVLEIPGLEDPLYLQCMGDGSLLVGEVYEPLVPAGEPHAGGTMHFTRFRLQAQGLHWVEEYRVRGFDGRALLHDGQGNVFATTRSGLHQLLPLQQHFQTTGTVETFALDSEQYGCQWHRIFLDLCLPEGTSASVFARTADDLYPEALRRTPRRPVGWPAGDSPADAAYERLPLGSPAPFVDDLTEGWLPVGTLDCRGAYGDRPFPPVRMADESACAASGEPGQPTETYEGLIKNPPGRFLWLRVELRSGSMRSPALTALRATFPRPSLLGLLPAFWRRDAQVAAQIDQLLSLFEGELTALDERIDALPALFDPRSAPSETLPWLASFVALGLDEGLTERARRELIRNAAVLYRQRGTRPGLERLCSIIAGCRARIVEGFQARRRTAAWLGVGTDPFAAPPSVILGPGLQLGGRDEHPQFHELEPWEQELAAAHLAALAWREEEAQRRAEDGLEPCPAQAPENPIHPDPTVAFYRKTAHRFTIFLYRRHDGEIARLLEEAVSAWKPAHTLHEFCWLDAGFRVGSNTYLDFGTRVGAPEMPYPAVLEHSPLGPATTLHRRPLAAGPVLAREPTARALLGAAAPPIVE